MGTTRKESTLSGTESQEKSGVNAAQLQRHRHPVNRQHVGRNSIVSARSRGNPDRLLNGHRQDESAVVIHVLADQVHPPRRANQQFGFLTAEVLPKAQESSADVLILDLTLQGGSGLPLIEQLTTAMPDLRVIVFSGLANSDEVSREAKRRPTA